MYIGGSYRNSFNHVFHEGRDAIDDELDSLKHFPYYFDDNITCANTNSKMFTILSINCASINAKIDQIKIKLQQLENNGTHVHGCLMDPIYHVTN